MKLSTYFIALLALFVFMGQAKGQQFKRESSLINFHYWNSVQASSGDYILAHSGQTGRLTLTGLNQFGDTLWNRYSQDITGNVVTFQECPDGGFFLCGNSSAPYLVKTDSLFNIQWSYIIPSIINQNFLLYGAEVENDPQFNIVVYGRVQNGNDWEGFYIEIDSAGQFIQSLQTFTPAVNSSSITAIKFYPNGQLLIAGQYGTGHFLGSQSFVNSGGSIRDLVILPSGKIFAVGSINSMGTLTKYTGTSTLQPTKFFTINGWDELTHINYDDKGKLVMLGKGSLGSPSNIRAVQVVSDTLMNFQDASLFNSSQTISSGKLGMNGKMHVISNRGQLDEFSVTDTSDQFTCLKTAVQFTDSAGFLNSNSGMAWVNITVGLTLMNWQFIPGSGTQDTMICFDAGCTALASFNASSLSGCVGDTFEFANQGNPAFAYRWMIDNMIVDSTFDFSRSFTQVGTHSISLIMEENDYCLDTSTMSIFVNAIPTVNIIGLDSIYKDCGAPDTLEGDPSGGVFDSPIIGNILYPNTFPLGANDIIYTYTDSAGCSSSDTSQIEVVSCTSLEQRHNDIEITFSANSSQLTLNNLPGHTEIRIFNFEGRKVVEHRASDSSVELPLNGYKSGVYIVWVLSEERIFVMKFLVSR